MLDGVYGSFNCNLYDHKIVHPITLKSADEEVLDCLSDFLLQCELNCVCKSYQISLLSLSLKVFKSSIWGPTCDALDQVCILKNKHFICGVCDSIASFPPLFHLRHEQLLLQSLFMFVKFSIFFFTMKNPSITSNNGWIIGLSLDTIHNMLSHCHKYIKNAISNIMRICTIWIPFGMGLFLESHNIPGTRALITRVCLCVVFF